MAQPTKSFSTDGSTQAFYTADNSNLQSDFTLEFWILHDATPGGAATMILDKWTGSGNNRDWQILMHPTLDFYFTNTSNGSSGSANNDSIGLGSMTTATWYHMALVHDLSAGTVAFWLAEEGGSHTLVATATGLNTTINNGTARYDWFSNNGSGNLFDGLVHDFRLWDDIRTETELNDNFENASMSDSEAGLVMRLRFQDDMADSSPSSDDATAVGTPSYSTTIPDWAAAGTTFVPKMMMF